MSKKRRQLPPHVEMTDEMLRKYWRKHAPQAKERREIEKALRDAVRLAAGDFSDDKETDGKAEAETEGERTEGGHTNGTPTVGGLGSGETPK